ncbi:ZYRO0G17754p [Zygosaccharomyces rouxii]|uniref:ZYRO0G17754p n=1 Tax=Zygosaccharomyces rouxii (strain ATCC 2623 / CBS 732 / NBRC 1130 / NCYC 568 / NRRL Y-229) TaxID=559307 RepID=C5E136_ZYGRC|nr:uncharacterized protein ZYRO0G17754g [Zygosaccharomyces rouxii]KAH9202813.1 hypothetical protein LQ764DRAFT_222924 [Zygosaccharomyces rouxii]CAR29820.1 ZYRO0G17754p [Zygosaccharomyces rouxii]
MERRIQELEEQHVRVHKEMLQTLDELYLAKLGSTSLDKEKRRTAEVRRQLQMSLEKSAVILRALERLGKQKSGTDDSDSTTEGLLAQRLGKLMDTNYKLDHTVSTTLSRQIELSKQLRNERKTYDTLANQLRQVSSQLQADKSASEIQQEPEPISLLQEDPQLERENDTIEQLLIALKVFGGYDFTT